MGLGGAAAERAGLPDLPDLGRPIQVQLPVVKKYFDAEAALFVDAREPEEYTEGHIPGAVNLSFDASVTDPERLEGLDTRQRPIIAYCGGGTCEVAMTLAESLIQAGHPKVLVFVEGYPAWVEAGYPSAKGGSPDRGAN